MESAIRLAQAEDVSAMVELSEQQRRLDQERYHLKFYHKAADSREKQLPYFQRQVADERVIALVHEPNGSIDGFIIGMLIDAPPVYDPGGLTCLVDDFVVQQPEAWSQIGAALLRQVNQLAKEQGAVQTVVVPERTQPTAKSTAGLLRPPAASVAALSMRPENRPKRLEGRPSWSVCALSFDMVMLP